MVAGKLERKASLFWLRVLAVTTTLVTFFVNLMGFVDTETGSALGCGANWPLCNGQLIPDSWNKQTIIEYAHRAIVGLLSLLLLALAVFMWRKYGNRREVRILVWISIGFVTAQAVLGAMAVFFTNPPTILALHFGFSLLAFAGVLLLTIFAWQVGNPSSKGGLALRQTAAPRPVVRWVWITLIYTYGAVYYGAYVTSTNIGEACQGWPLCNGQLIPPLHGTVGLDFLHRALALGLVIVTANLIRLTHQIRVSRPDLYRGSWLAVLFIILQAFSGAYLVFDHLDLNAFLLHVSIMSGFFGILAYLGMQIYPASVPRTKKAFRFGRTGIQP